MNIGSMMGGAPSAAMIKGMQQKMFAKQDANNDGSIDKSEMTDFAKKAGMDTSKVDEMFQTADADSDGKITESENAAMMDKIGEKMKTLFSQSHSGGTKGANSTGSSDDVLMNLMAQIRKNSESGDTAGLKQFLANLKQQSTSYNHNGVKENATVSALFTQLA